MIKRTRVKGFTLIEVMIAVVIVGILASVAFASYQNFVIRSNRADAKSALNDASQRLQRCFTLHNDYTDDDCQVHDDLNSGGGIESSEGFYEISFDGSVSGTNPTATTYTLIATPVRAPQTSDTDCSGANAMTLAQTGRRQPEECW